MARRKKTNSTIAEQIQSAIADLSDLRYVVDYEYDKDCSECNSNDYHRNCVIVNFEIKDVNARSCVERVLSGVTDPILRYCIERILHIKQIYNQENWDSSVSRGYYGEEVDDVWFTGRGESAAMIGELEPLSDRDRVLKVLEYEYGFILPALQEIKAFTVKEVELEDIVFPNDHYVAKVGLGASFYPEWPYPLGVCVTHGQKYKIIDGYHRLSTAVMEASKSGTSTVSIVVGSK